LQSLFKSQRTIKNSCFGKWYLTNSKEAEDIIGKYLGSDDKKKEEERKKAEAEKKRQEEEKRRLEEQKQIEQEKKKIEEERKRFEQEKLKEKKKLEEQKQLEQERRRIDEERKKIQAEREKLHKQLEQERQTMLKEIESKKPAPQIQKKSGTQTKSDSSPEEDPFFSQLLNYFKEKKIEIVKYNIVRKKSDIDLILKIPSILGALEYYCKAKNKKTVSDGDLSSAVVQGQLKKLPVLFLSPGKPTKKAEELLNTELKKGIIIKKL